MVNDVKPAVWVLAASGNTDDPTAHAALLAELRAVLAKPEYGCGSSEFNGPYAAEPNFHANTDTGDDSGTGAEVTGAAQDGPTTDYPTQNPSVI